MRKQTIHDANFFKKKKNSVTLLCDGELAPSNIGALFRIADSFGIPKIHFKAKNFPIGSKRMERTSRTTHKLVPYSLQDDFGELIKSFKENGVRCIGLEITNDSMPIRDIAINPGENIALVVGHEKTGISKTVLDALDLVVHIPMYGLNSSMNVAVATGIGLYEITEKLQRSV